MSPRIATAALLALPLLSGCISDGELEAARQQEARAEAVLADAEALPESAPGKAALVADAQATERELERIRQALEQLDRGSLIGTGIDAVSKGARGDYFGVLDVLSGLAAAAGAYFLAGRKSTSHTAERLADLERRRDESRAQQGIAAASERSAVQAQSAVALAAKDIQERAAALAARQAVAQQMRAARANEVTGSLAPRTTSDLMAQLELELGDPGTN